MVMPQGERANSDAGVAGEGLSVEAITRRIAKAVAHPLRVRILAALNEAEMGPAEFTRRNPDVDLRDVSQHFRRLRDMDCIELVGRRPGRGGERVYRAVRRAMFDLSTWQAVPPERRRGVTGEVLSTYLNRVAQAAETGTLDTREERWVSWTFLQFDEPGWNEYIDSLEAVFARSLELGVEAPLRLAATGTRSIPVTVGLFCFESPRSEDLLEIQHQPSAAPGSLESPFLGLRSAKALATPLRVRILVELNRRPLSPKAFHAKQEGIPLQHIAVEFRRLEQLGCIEPVGRRRSQGGRGRPEQIYRALRRSLFDEETWKQLPSSLRGDVTNITYTTFIERVAEAARADVLDARADRHFTWSAMRYDLAAWRELLELLDGLFHLSLQIHREAAARIKASVGEPVPVTVAMSCFESPSTAEMTPKKVLQEFIGAKPEHLA